MSLCDILPADPSCTAPIEVGDDAAVVGDAYYDNYNCNSYINYYSYG